MELPQLALKLVNPFSFVRISAKIFLCLGGLLLEYNSRDPLENNTKRKVANPKQYTVRLNLYLNTKSSCFAGEIGHT